MTMNILYKKIFIRKPFLNKSQVISKLQKLKNLGWHQPDQCKVKNEKGSCMFSKKNCMFDLQTVTGEKILPLCNILVRLHIEAQHGVELLWNINWGWVGKLICYAMRLLGSCLAHNVSLTNWGRYAKLWVRIEEVGGVNSNLSSWPKNKYGLWFPKPQMHWDSLGQIHHWKK